MATTGPEDDFQGYMENLGEMQKEAEKHAAMMEAHERWRQTTWGGWAVRQLQALGNHFAPFFEAVADMFGADENSPKHIILIIILRAVIISGYLVAAFAIARIINFILGREIVIEEEVIVEDDGDEDECASEQKGEEPQLRTARDKKSR